MFKNSGHKKTADFAIGGFGISFALPAIYICAQSFQPPRLGK
jgi:hypothetical protein